MNAGNGSYSLTYVTLDSFGAVYSTKFQKKRTL